MAGNFKMNDDYIEVAERIALFKSAYPDGTLQPLDHLNPYVVQEVGGETLIVYAAAAYRTPDDPRPGVGVASEVFPGRTPYTKGSEVANAETSAWGRAIVALGIPSKHVATREDVRNRQAEQGDAGKGNGADQQREQAAKAEPAPNGTITQAQAKRLHEDLYSKGRASKWFLGVIAGKNIGDGEHLTSIPSGEYERLLEIVAGFADPPPPEPTTPAAAPAAAESVSAEDFTQPAPATQEAVQEVAAPAAASAASEADDDGFGEFDAELDKAAEEKAPKEKAYKVGSITAPQLTRIGAQCGELERLGVGTDEWRFALAEEFNIAHRDELVKTKAPKVIDYLARWIADVKTGVRGPGEKAVA